MLDLFKDLRFPLGPFPEARFTRLSCDFPNQDEGEVVYNYNQEHKEVHEDINFSDRLSNRQTEAQRRLKILKQVCPSGHPTGLGGGGVEVKVAGQRYSFSWPVSLGRSSRLLLFPWSLLWSRPHPAPPPRCLPRGANGRRREGRRGSAGPLAATRASLAAEHHDTLTALSLLWVLAISALSGYNVAQCVGPDIIRGLGNQ